MDCDDWPLVPQKDMLGQVATDCLNRPPSIVPAVVSAGTAIGKVSVVNMMCSHNIYHIDIDDGGRDRL
jgi:hypothetical protein